MKGGTEARGKRNNPGYAQRSNPATRGYNITACKSGDHNVIILQAVSTRDYKYVVML